MVLAARGGLGKRCPETEMHVVSLHPCGEAGWGRSRTHLGWLSSRRLEKKKNRSPLSCVPSEANRGQHRFFVASRNLEAPTPLSL